MSTSNFTYSRSEGPHQFIHTLSSSHPLATSGHNVMTRTSQFSQNYSLTPMSQTSHTVSGPSSVQPLAHSFYQPAVSSGQTTYMSSYGGRFGHGYESRAFGGATEFVSQGAPRIVGVHEGQPVVVDVREGQSRIIEERMHEGASRVVGERQGYAERRSVAAREMRREAPRVETVRSEKVIEVLKERPYPVERFVDVMYDVVVDVPIERTIERDRIIETVIEKPIEKTIEIPIEQVYEVPVERVIERPVEIKRTLEVPYERIVQVPYEVTRDNITYHEHVIDLDEREVGRYQNAYVMPTSVQYQYVDKIREVPVYHENMIEQTQYIERPRIIEVPVERVVHVPRQTIIERPFPVEREIVHELTVPVYNEIIQPIDYIIEQPIYIENIIERPVAVERLKEIEVEVPIEHIIERPVFIENIIQKPVEVTVAVPVAQEQVVEVPREQLHVTEMPVVQFREIPVERVVKKSVPRIRQVQVPVDIETPVTTFKDREVEIEHKVQRMVAVPVEVVVERPVTIERIVEKPRFVDKEIKVEKEVVTENVKTVEKIVEKPVPFDVVLEKQVEVIVEKEVQVPVEKRIEVPLTVKVERPVFREVVTEEPRYYEKNDVEFNEVFEELEIPEVEDEGIKEEIKERRADLMNEQSKNEKLRAELNSLQREYHSIREFPQAEVHENARLKGEFSAAATRLRSMEKQREDLVRRSQSRKRVTETQLRKDPRYTSLRSQLKTLVAENNMIVEKIAERGRSVEQERADSVNRLRRK